MRPSLIWTGHRWRGSSKFWFRMGVWNRYSSGKDRQTKRLFLCLRPMHAIYGWHRWTMITCLVSFRSVGLCVWIRPSPGSCHPTRTSLAFGVLFRSSGPLLCFQVSTQRAQMILSVETRLLLHRDVTRFSIHEFHSFCRAPPNSFLSWGLRLRNDTSSLRCLASKQSSQSSQRHKRVGCYVSG